MFLIPRKRIWTQQPQGAAQIDWSNPITRGVDFCYTPSTGEIFKRRTVGVTAAGTGVATGRAGLALALSSTKAAKFGNVTPLSGVGYSVLVFAARTGTLGAYARLFDTRQGSATGTALFMNSGGSGQNAIRARCTQSILNFDLTATLTDSLQPTVICFTSKDADARLYENGKQIAQTTSGGPVPTSSASNQYLIGSENASSVTSPYNGLVFLVTEWTRALSADEAYSVSLNPWQLFRAPDSRIFVPVSAGGSALAAAASGSSTASGSANLAAQVALGAVGVSLASGSASASVAVPLSAVGITVAGGSANGTATVTISAAGLAQAAGQAGLSASILLQAAGAAQAAGNAALAAKLSALASGAAQASGSANLSGGAPGALSAVGSATAGGAAVLKVTVQLVASGSAQVSGTATGTAGAPGAISASGSAQSGGSGTASVAVALTAAGFVQAMGAGFMSVQASLSAIGASFASGSASAIMGGLLVIDSRYVVKSKARDFTVRAKQRNFTVKSVTLH